MSGKSRSNQKRKFIPSDVTAITDTAVRMVRHSWAWERVTKSGFFLTSLVIYPPSAQRNGMWLVVGKSWDEGYKMVAFYRAPDMLSAVVGFLDRAAAGKVEWKRDKWDE